MYRTVRNLIAAAPIATLAVTMVTGIAHAETPDPPRPPAPAVLDELDLSGLLGSEPDGGSGGSSGTDRGRYLSPRIPRPDLSFPVGDDGDSDDESGSDDGRRVRIPGLRLGPDIPDYRIPSLPFPVEPDDSSCGDHDTDPDCDGTTTDPCADDCGGTTTDPCADDCDGTSPNPSGGHDPKPGPTGGGDDPGEFPVPELIDAGSAAGSADDGSLELVWLLAGGGVLTASGVTFARRIQKARNG